MVPLLAIGGGEDDFIIVALALEFGDEVVNGFYLHYHAGTSAERVVVGAAVLVGSVVTYVVDDYIGQSLFLGTRHDGAVEETLYHLG